MTSPAARSAASSLAGRSHRSYTRRPHSVLEPLTLRASRAAETASSARAASALATTAILAHGRGRFASSRSVSSPAPAAADVGAQGLRGDRHRTGAVLLPASSSTTASANASASSRMCDSSAVSGGDTAIEETSGRTSTPRRRRSSASSFTAPGRAASNSALNSTAARNPVPPRTLPYGRRRLDGPQRLEQRLLELAAARHELLALEDVEVRQRGRAADRVAGVRLPVAEDRALRTRTARPRGPRRPRRRAAGSRS